MKSITCPRCGLTSHHPMDIKYGYCGNCKDYTSVPGGGAVNEKPASEWDLNLAVFENTEGTVAMIEALRRYGARDVEFGFTEEDFNERWPEQPITAYAHVKYRVKKGYELGRYFDREEVVCEHGTEFDFPAKALNEALARVVRKLGGNVVLVEK